MRSRLLAIIGIAFCAGALTTVWTMTHRAVHQPQAPRQTQGLLGSTEAAGAARGSIGTLPDVQPVPASPTGVRDRPASDARPTDDPGPISGVGEAPALPREARALEARGLSVPVQGVSPDALQDSFYEARGGSRRHEALDILAPRGTPVIAADAGRIVKLFESKAGGTTIYQFDPSEQYCYYYAHLDRYAEGLHEGQIVTSGQVLGYVGTTGNAPPDTPHLHFAIFKLGPDKHWWEGEPIDPKPLLHQPKDCP